MNKSVMILDDHPLFSVGLKAVINQEPKLNVVDVCRTSVELFFALSIGSADILLLDCSRPLGETNVRTLVERLHQQQPHSALMLMGDNELHRQVAERCSSMIAGYFCKTLPPESFILGLHRIRRRRDGESIDVPEKKGLSESEITRLPSRLSAKEKTVLEYLHAGLSVTQTAARVNRSVKTISTQKRTAMRKLGLKQERDIFQLNLHEL